MDLLAQIPVHRVALTSVQSYEDEAGATVLHPAVAIWCDLDAVPDEAMPWAEEDEVPSVFITDAYLLPDRARVALSLLPAGVTPQDLADGAADGLTAAPFTVVVPTTALALATSMMLLPDAVTLVLIDGTPPKDPEFTVVDPDEIAALIELHPHLTHDALCGTVPDILHMPVPFDVPQADEDTEDRSGGAEPMRDLLWAAVAGIALGQPWAMHRVSELAAGCAQWAADANHPDADKAAAMVLAASRLADASYDDVQAHDVAVSVADLPVAMAGLATTIRERVAVEPMMLLLDGVAFARVATEHGLDKALPALAVVAAARANAIAAPATDGVTCAWLLGSWLDQHYAEPTWATRPLLDLLTHHDPAVATDLLAVGPAGATSQDASPVLHRYLHVAADAIVLMDMPSDMLTTALAEHAVRPVNHHDVTLLATALADAAHHGHEDLDDEHGEPCAGCLAAQTVLESGWNLKRLAAAAAALLPCLADVSAIDNGFAVGEQDWVTHRVAFLGQALDVVARATPRAA